MADEKDEVEEADIDDAVEDDEEEVQTFECEKQLEGCEREFKRTESEIEDGASTEVCDSCAGADVSSSSGSGQASS